MGVWGPHVLATRRIALSSIKLGGKSFLVTPH
ncbi:hypothetical protein H4W80_005863 [Nonomuraea angiospora]|uniref:Uncharacterized protein n=1 Tax=Nonomuraea angiospora TaxID=46172 RepID=A0ABR9M4V0_9ACTN|nr:hypothetical protein [Nonomuraea angiospora]